MRNAAIVLRLGALLLAGCGGPGSTAIRYAAPAIEATGGPLLDLRERSSSDSDIRISDGIVDINSVIELKLDRDRVAEAIPMEWNAEFPPERLEALRKLSNAVAAGEESIVVVRQALIKWASSDKSEQDRSELQVALEQTAEPFLEMLEAIGSNPELRARANDQLENLPEGTSQVEQDVIIARLAAELVEREQAALGDFLERNGVFFQVGAWLVVGGATSPIHLPGFDRYPEQEHFEVERWSVRFDESQQKQFTEIQSTAKELNQKLVGPESGLHVYRDLLSSMLRDTAEKCVSDLETALRDLASEDPDVAAVKELIDQVESFDERIDRLRAKYSSIDTHSADQVLLALAGLHDDLRDTHAALKAMLASARTVMSALQPGAAGSKLAELQAKWRDVSSGCFAEFLSTLEKLAEGLGLEIAAADLNQELFEFTEEVERHTLVTLPTSSEFDLCTSGQRAAGDRVVLKVAVGRAAPDGDASAKPERRVLETRRLTLYRVEPHLTTTVSLIWANPGESSALVRDYQAAASYSVLYKWGRRDSDLFNSLWSPGVGINLAALDFDKDDNPEVGVALVVTLVRDYLQAGYGYDAAVDTDYWFFGLRLPLPTWTMPGQGSDPGSP